MKGATDFSGFRKDEKEEYERRILREH